MTRATTPPGGALRLDPASGVSEEAGFLGADPERIFCVTSLPRGTPRAGVVLCCPILSEQLKTYRTEVLAARAFAAQGLAVVRFHYRGTGHSGGITETLTLESMLADARRVSDHLREAAQVDALVFCGARWGGLVAGLAAQERPGAFLAMWEPVVDGQRYFRETFRASQLSALASGGTSLMTVAQALDTLGRDGQIDALGHPVHLGLYESAGARTLMDIDAAAIRGTLLVQVSRRRELRPEVAALKAALERGGSAVETAFIEGEEAWSFIHSRAPSSLHFIEVTLSWLNRMHLRAS